MTTVMVGSDKVCTVCTAKIRSGSYVVVSNDSTRIERKRGVVDRKNTENSTDPGTHGTHLLEDSSMEVRCQ